MPKFEVFKSRRKNQPWSFRLRGANGEIVCQSEGYATRSSAVRATRALPQIAAVASLP